MMMGISLQAEGQAAVQLLQQKVARDGGTVLWHGAWAAASATAVPQSSNLSGHQVGPVEIECHHRGVSDTFLLVTIIIIIINEPFLHFCQFSRISPVQRMRAGRAPGWAPR